MNAFSVFASALGQNILRKRSLANERFFTLNVTLQNFLGL